MSRSHPDPTSIGLVAWAAPLIVCAGGCVQEMANQPRVESFEASSFFKDGIGARHQVQGTIARGQTWQRGIESSGKDEKGFVHNPYRATTDSIREGRRMFNINCQHCHGPAGYGDGMVVQRGFPQPPSYHSDRLREMEDGRLFEVITQGHGRMPAFGKLLAIQDRWSIVAYVRVLQLSQHFKSSDLTATQKADLANTSDQRKDP